MNILLGLTLIALAISIFFNIKYRERIKELSNDLTAHVKEVDEKED